MHNTKQYMNFFWTNSPADWFRPYPRAAAAASAAVATSLLLLVKGELDVLAAAGGGGGGGGGGIVVEVAGATVSPGSNRETKEDWLLVRISLAM